MPPLSARSTLSCVLRVVFLLLSCSCSYSSSSGELLGDVLLPCTCECSNGKQVLQDVYGVVEQQLLCVHLWEQVPVCVPMRTREQDVLQRSCLTAFTTALPSASAVVRYQRMPTRPQTGQCRLTFACHARCLLWWTPWALASFAPSSYSPPVNGVLRWVVGAGDEFCLEDTAYTTKREMYCVVFVQVSLQACFVLCRGTPLW